MNSIIEKEDKENFQKCLSPELKAMQEKLGPFDFANNNKSENNF